MHGTKIKVTDFFFTILPKLETPRQIFIKIPNIKFHVNPSSGSRADTFKQTDGKTDVHEECNRHFRD
jgi:hypothetical protein